MNIANPSLEIDVKTVSGGAAHKTRTFNNGRHHGKMPDIFPDVLADVAVSKNVAAEATAAMVPSPKSAIPRDEMDTSDRKEDLPAEEKALRPAMPVDMKDYLQVIAAVAQKQTVDEPPPPAIAAPVLATIVSRSEIDVVEVKQTDADPESASKDAVEFDAPKFPDLKATEPRKPVDQNGKSSPIQPSALSTMENPSEPPKIFQPEAPQEISQPKTAEVEVRVIKVETSFSPAVPSPFVMQVAKVIVDGLGGPVQTSVAVTSKPLADPRREVVKSIQIQLHPDDLGKIKVAMHLRGDELKLQIEVTNKAVETFLLNDHQALKDVMSQAGYDIKDASISIAVSTADPIPPQRSVAASDPPQGSMVGQGGRQHPGASEENQNPFQKARGHHVSASDFENGGEARVQASGSRRGNGVFI